MRLRFTWVVLVLQGFAAALVFGADEGVLFSDDFTLLRPGWWGTATDERDVMGNKLLMTPKESTTYTNLLEGHLFADADIRVKVALTGSPSTVTIDGGTRTLIVPAGLVFWATDIEHFCVALVNSGGGFIVSRYEKGAGTEWKLLLRVMRSDAAQPGSGRASEIRERRARRPGPQLLRVVTSDAVQVGPGNVNEIRIVTKGNSGTAYVNSQLIGTFEGDPPKGGSKIGLRAGSGNDRCVWEFSDLVVRKPQ